LDKKTFKNLKENILIKIIIQLNRQNLFKKRLNIPQNVFQYRTYILHCLKLNKIVILFNFKSKKINNSNVTIHSFFKNIFLYFFNYLFIFFLIIFNYLIYYYK